MTNLSEIDHWFFGVDGMFKETNILAAKNCAAKYLNDMLGLDDQTLGVFMGDDGIFYCIRALEYIEYLPPKAVAAMLVDMFEELYDNKNDIPAIVGQAAAELMTASDERVTEMLTGLLTLYGTQKERIRREILGDLA